MLSGSAYVTPIVANLGHVRLYFVRLYMYARIIVPWVESAKDGTALLHLLACRPPQGSWQRSDMARVVQLLL